jgi:hypothetical protein
MWRKRRTIMMTHSSHIGTLAEKSLHAALKTWLGRPGDRFEVEVDGFVVDIVRGEQLIEIQTGNFTAMKRKLGRLLNQHPIHLIHPIAREKWIVRQTADGAPISRRKSPRRGQTADLFYELVRIPHLLAHPNLTIEALLVQEEEIWRDDGGGSWRRGRWSRYDRRLLAVVEQAIFATPADFCCLLPAELPHSFTNRDLAAWLNGRLPLAQKLTYTLCHAGALTVSGKQGRAHLYTVKGEG